jgi:hypothetical protein
MTLPIAPAVQKALDARDPSALSASDELHQFATSWNWDDGVAGLEYVVQHPNCDLGTALEVYWLGNPVETYTEYTSAEEADVDFPGLWLLLEMIEARVGRNGFPLTKIAFDPTHDTAGGEKEAIDWTEGWEETERPIPEMMTKAVKPKK